jgi:aspartate/methionine/tyrosine aminotransferase
LHEHFARSAQAFDAKTRPDGYIPLCIAENKLISDFVLHKLSECHELPKDALGYDAMTGSLAVREALVDFMSKRFLGRRFAAEQIALLSGAGSVLEILFHVIADAGDGVLVPTPSYAGFWADLETRDELTIVPVHTSNADGFRLTAQLLDAALDKAPCPIRALLFTSPDNPTGRVYSESEIRSVLEWADRAGVHLVMDEIYALSVFGDKPFVSAARLLSTLGERVHLVWAFSKDFGMSGARVGVLVSENTALLRAVDALAYWACCSGPTQHLIARMLAD